MSLVQTALPESSSTRKSDEDDWSADLQGLHASPIGQRCVFFSDYADSGGERQRQQRLLLDFVGFGRARGRGGAGRTLH